MSDFFSPLKSDLLDRRFLPILVLLGVALIAALTYAVLGSGGSSTSSTPAPSVASSGVTRATAVVVSQAPSTNPNQAVAETTSGASKQHGGVAHNPFSPLPGAKSATASSGGSTAASKGSSSSATSSSGTSSSGSGKSPSSGATTPATTPKPTTPAKPKPQPPRQVYQVDVLFGVAPAGTPSQNIPLTSFNNLTRLDPLTAGGEAPLVFAGVSAGGKSAIFTLVREVILHGPAVCHPSASQCQAIQLAPGQSEELEYVLSSTQTLIYKIQLVSITAVKATAAKAAKAFHAESKAGRTLLRRAGLSALPGLRYSLNKGVVVVLGGHRAFAAHAARRR